MNKRCTRCGKTKSLVDFSLYRSDGSGCRGDGTGPAHRSVCKVCVYAQLTRYKVSKAGSLTSYDRLYRLRKGSIWRSRTAFKRNLSRTGISVEDFARMLHSSNFECFNLGCRKPIDLDGVPGSWGLDHDHSHCSGVSGCATCIRGILCHGCNTALGLLGDSGEKIHGLYLYLTGHSPLGTTPRDGLGAKMALPPPVISAPTTGNNRKR